MTLRRWITTLGAGLLAGLTAVLAMTFVMAALRYVLGVPTPPELVGDRIAPLLGVERFLRMLSEAGGYDQLKQMGITYVLAGQIGVGALAGLLYAAVVERGRVQDPEQTWRFGVSRRGWLVAGLVVGVIWLITLVLLWPNLDTNYRGLPPDQATITTALGLLISYAIYGLVLVLSFRLMTVHEPLRQRAALGTPVGRRAVLVGGAGAALAVASGGIIRDLRQRSTFSYDGLQYKGADVQPITPNDRFYVVTKNVVDPNPWKAFWQLNVTGRVERSRTYDFDDIAALPATEQETTLMCISNSVGSGLMSNAVWRGVPLRTLLEDAGPRSDAVEVALHGADGYTDTIPIEKAMDPVTFVAYQMNGEPLPDRHGFPVRVLVPGMFGEKSVKWVTEIEVVDHDAKGFYEAQGWGPDFIVPIRSRFDVPASNQSFSLAQESTVPAKGIAFAGDQGISSVEVSTDGGESWNAATIEYAGTRLTWSLWRYAWQPDEPGEYQLAVRATDGNGEPQPETDDGIVPEGATGYHRITVRVEA